MSKAKLFIEGAIVSDKDPFMEAFGIDDPSFSPKDMSQFIKDNEGMTELEIEIRSDGGIVDAGFDIYDQIRALSNQGIKVITVGFRVHSCATVLFLAGDTRIIAENAAPVVHNPRIDGYNLGSALTADDLAAISDEIRAIENRLINFYAERLSLDEDTKAKLQEQMKADKSMSSSEFKDYGFATEILKTNASASASAKRIPSYSNKIAAILNKNHNNPNNKMDVKEVKAKVNGIESIVKKIAAKLGFKANEDGTITEEVKASTVTLDDGTPIYFDGQTIAVDTAVFTDEAMTAPVADGDYTLDNGDTFTVAGGIVTVYTESGAEAQALEEANQTIEAQKAEITALKKQVKELQGIKADFKKLADEVAPVMALVSGEKPLGGAGGAELSPAQKFLAEQEKRNKIFNKK